MSIDMKASGNTQRKKIFQQNVIIKKEIVKPYPLQPEYKVSNQGYVLSKRNPLLKLKPSVNPKGYEIVQLMNNGKRYGVSVHKIIAITFLGFPSDIEMQVNHIDGNKRNNNINNLEWVTPKQNMEHSSKVLLRNFSSNNCNAKAVNAISTKDSSKNLIFPSLSDVARFFQHFMNIAEFSYAKQNIWRALSHYNNHHTAYGYHWVYL